MPARVTSFCIPDDMRKRVNLAAASMGLNSSEFIRGSIMAALETCAERDPALRAHFAFLEEREAQAERAVLPV